jgi:hypothetical protein
MNDTTQEELPCIHLEPGIKLTSADIGIITKHFQYREQCIATLKAENAAAQSQAAALRVELDEAKRNIALYKELHKAGNFCAKQAAAMAGLLEDLRIRLDLLDLWWAEDAICRIDDQLAAWKGNTK